MEPVAIETRALTKRFGKVRALDALDLEVPAGRAVGLVGPSGAGKSTLVRVLAGLVRPSGGSARLDGVDVAGRGATATRDRLGVAHQHVRFQDWMTGRELLALVLDLAAVPAGAAEGKVEAAIETTGLGKVAARRIGSWTDAERARLNWAQAVVNEPAIVVLDDPFAGLDPASEATLDDLLARLRERGATVLMTTRRPGDVSSFDDTVSLAQGHLVEPARDAATGQDARPHPQGIVVYLIEVDPGAGVALAGLVTRLRAEPWVTDVAADGGALRVVVDDDDRASRELLPAITATGLPVFSFRRVRS